MTVRPSYKKPVVYRDPAAAWLMKLSKAALVDCVIDLLRGASESFSEPVSVERASERLTPVLIMRGDKEPTPTKSAEVSS